jgi:hypothetical protein
MDVLENSKQPLCEYNLINSNGEIISTAKLTKLEAEIKNYAFGLNRANKRYELDSCIETIEDDDSSVKLIVP